MNKSIPGTDPHITLIIPSHLIKDYLGIFAIDVLHDAKGRGYLVGNKLSQLTDLIAFSISLHNQEITLDEHPLKVYVFQQVLSYIVDLWESRISALGIDTRPDFNNTDSSYWETLRQTVQLPFRNVAERDTEDAFISLGGNKLGIESQNYSDQKDKLTRSYAEILAFVSPKGIYKPSDYFLKASGIVDIIQNRTNFNSKVVLDMKSSAGLIRTITDPIGYRTGLPTYADPGYNMPGMSAIRQHAELAFIDENTEELNRYNQGSNEFRYQVKLHTPMTPVPIVFLDVRYFYGIAKDGLDRSNLMISILENTFSNTLPHSITMAEALSQYLRPRPRVIKLTVSEVIERLHDLAWDHYGLMCQPVPFLQNLNAIYTNLHYGHDVSVPLSALLKDMPCTDTTITFLVGWCNEQNTIVRISYILATIRILYHFNIKHLLPLVKQSCLLPETMITKNLPDLLFHYIDRGNQVQDYLVLAFCHHQHLLLKQFIGTTSDNSGIPYQQELSEALAKQWIPKRKGKVVSQLTKLVQDWHKQFVELLQQEAFYLKTYILQQLLSVCHTNLGLIFNGDSIDEDDPRVIAFLQSLPVFQPSANVRKALSDQLHFYYPELYHQTIDMPRDGLLLSVLLTQKSLLGIDLHRELSATLDPSFPGFNIDVATEALNMVLGKFSGDFGQIMWCMCYGHLFASEDNNTSAMALLLHRLPKDHIQCNTDNSTLVWGNIHGLGDGGSVDIIIDRPTV